MPATLRILAAISSDTVFLQFEPLVNRSDLLLTRVRSGQHALTLAREMRCDLVLCQHPMVDVGFEEFYAGLRGSDCASDDSTLLVVARDDRRDELRELLEGDEQFFCVGLDPEQVKDALGELVGVALRTDTRLLVETCVNCNRPASKQVFQTANLSESGFLLRSQKPLPVGSNTSFTLTLPDSEKPVVGRAEVVRHTNSENELFAGMGLRVLEVDGDGRRRLAEFVRQHLD